MATAPASPRTDLDREKFRELLMNTRARLVDDVRRTRGMDSSADGLQSGELSHYDQHDADQGTELQLREQDEALIAQALGELNYVDAALERVDDGTYGYCERCGAEIPEARLEVLPFAPYCMKCATDLQGQY